MKQPIYIYRIKCVLLLLRRAETSRLHQSSLSWPHGSLGGILALGGNDTGDKGVPVIGVEGSATLLGDVVMWDRDAVPVLPLYAAYRNAKRSRDA